MPRTVEEILAHADSLADRFEQHEPSDAASVANPTLSGLRAAVLRRAEAERLVLAGVIDARRNNTSWDVIGTMIGTTGEAARQRYGDVAARELSDDHVQQAILAVLRKAGFSPDELREFATLLEFAGVLLDAGQSGSVGSIEWSPEKARAMVEALQLMTGDEGMVTKAPSGARTRPRKARSGVRVSVGDVAEQSENEGPAATSGVATRDASSERPRSRRGASSAGGRREPAGTEAAKAADAVRTKKPSWK